MKTNFANEWTVGRKWWWHRKETWDKTRQNIAHTFVQWTESWILRIDRPTDRYPMLCMRLSENWKSVSGIMGGRSHLAIGACFFFVEIYSPFHNQKGNHSIILLSLNQQHAFNPQRCMEKETETLLVFSFEALFVHHAADAIDIASHFSVVKVWKVSLTTWTKEHMFHAPTSLLHLMHFLFDVLQCISQLVAHNCRNVYVWRLQRFIISHT